MEEEVPHPEERGKIHTGNWHRGGIKRQVGLQVGETHKEPPRVVGEIVRQVVEQVVQKQRSHPIEGLLQCLDASGFV